MYSIITILIWKRTCLVMREYMKSRITLFSFVWLTLVIIPETTIINQTIGNALFITHTLIFLLYISYEQSHIKMTNNKLVFLPIIIITSILFYHTIQSQLQFNYQYFYIIYTIIPVLTAIYVFPNYNHVSNFKQFAAISGSVLVLIAVPAYLFGEYTILWFEVRLAENAYYPDRMTSIFSQSGNQFAPLLLVSIISSVDLFRRTSNIWLVALIINLFGLVATNSRTGISGIILGLVIYIIAVKGPRWIVGAAVGGVVAVTLATLMFVFNIRPWPSLVEIIGFEARRGIWEAAALSMDGNQLLGHGLIGSAEAYGDFLYEPQSPHNGYVNAYITTGILGVTSYVLLYTYTVLRSYLIVPSPFCLSLLSVFLYWQVFNGAWLITNAMESILMAILIGYVLYPHTVD